MASCRFSVTFDLWETLLIDEAEKDLLRRRMRCEGLRRVLSRFGLDLTLADIFRGYDSSVAWFQSFWRVNRDIPTIEQIRYVVKIASGSSTVPCESWNAVKELEEAYTAPALVVTPSLNPDAVPTLNSMRDRGYRIGLISNTGRTPGRVLRLLLNRLGILHYFCATVFSDEVGWLKPDRRIFHAAAEKLGVEMPRIVHIGDDPERDAWGAKQAGMRAILLEYEVPKAFKEHPGSLFAISRDTRSVDDSEIKPDGRIESLRDALKVIDCLG